MRGGYRKGTVLGLTIAEIFILLIFLLLLAMLTLNSQWNEKNRGYEETLAELRSANTDVPFITPEQIETLYARMTEAELARERYQGALAQEQKYRKEAEEALAQEQGRRIKAEEEQAQERENRKTTEEALAQEQEHRNKAEEELTQAQENFGAAEEALERALKGQEEAEITLDVLRRKGENPSCWYETVAAGDGKSREKAHYMFNVAVFDTGLVLARSPVPSGAATDDGGPPYAEEARWLGVAEIPYGQHLSDEAFTKHLKPLVEQGKQSKVRTYSCVFFIRVWDKTSPGAKDRWKQAHDRVLEGMFGTYNVRNDPWPGPREAR